MNHHAGRCALVAVWIVSVLAGCASGPTLSVDRAPDIELAEARSYGWVDVLGTDRAGYESLVTARLKRAVGRALEREGLVFRADDPDMLVNFYVNLEDRQEVRSVPTGFGTTTAFGPGLGYHGYRLGLYEPWPDYRLEVREYRVGTLTLDLVDADSGRLAWEGVAVGRVSRRTLEAPDAALDAVLEQLLERYP